MHSSERERLILQAVGTKEFVAFKALEQILKSSPATIRRDLERLATEGRLVRLHGGVRAVSVGDQGTVHSNLHLNGVPFRENIQRNREQKEAIGKAAADLCQPGEGIMVDGGSTTLQMCPHMAGLGLQVLTNSLHIVSALINQAGTKVLVPSGAVFPEQSIILSVFGDDGMPRFHAPKLFMGAAAIGPQGLMQADVVLVASERRLIDKANEIIVLADASKFEAPSGNVVCALEELDIVVTDDRISDEAVQMLESAGVCVVIADHK
jgi:DeoR family ulaG and ulaABCDEF operon transcriptional repressor